MEWWPIYTKNSKLDIDTRVDGGLGTDDFWAVIDLVVLLKVRGANFGEVSSSMISKSIVSIHCLAIKESLSRITTRERETKRWRYKMIPDCGAGEGLMVIPVDELFFFLAKIEAKWEEDG